MKTLAVRLYGKDDLRLEEFDLPELSDDEILAEVVSDSLCMSSFKAVKQGPEHKRVPKDVAERPVIIGHEFCGTIVTVGKKWQDRFHPGQRYTVQPALNYPGRELEAPGYSFPYIGGDATLIVIPREVMEMDCLLPYEGEAFFKASLAEPLSCIIGAFNTQYHYRQGEYEHRPGIVEGGVMAILGGGGPMGLLALDYVLHGKRKPRVLVVTDVDPKRLEHAASIFSSEQARAQGVELHYLDTSRGDPVEMLKAASHGRLYDDVFVFAPVVALIEQASRIMGFNGCLNFFAGPPRSDFFASINFYDVHYMGHHVVGSSGGNKDDLRLALDLVARNIVNPAVMITHVGGLDAVPEATKNLASIPGGKKLIYTQISMPLVALEDLEKLGQRDCLFAELAQIVAEHNGLWCTEAEQYLLAHAPRLWSRYGGRTFQGKPNG